VSTIFPKWMNALPTIVAGGAVSTAALAVGGVWYYFTPKFWDVGYMPHQPALTEEAMTDLRRAGSPVAGVDYPGFSHQIHAGELGMDCRYCHTNVEDAAEANIPSVSTCYGCHSDGKLKKLNDSSMHKKKTEFIRTAWAADAPIPWRRVHKVPDYVRNFPHNAHVNAGVSCYSCHGNIARMPVVWQHEPLSMGWCLDCHREPEKHVINTDPTKGGVAVTRLFDVESLMMPANSAARQAEGAKEVEWRRLNPPQGCGACHY
jgi:hypothetical protein